MEATLLDMTFQKICVKLSWRCHRSNQCILDTGSYLADFCSHLKKF